MNVTPTIVLPPWVSSAPPLDAESFENVSSVRLTPACSSSSPPPLPVALAPVTVRFMSWILPVGKALMVLALKMLSPAGAVTVTPGPPVIVSVEPAGSLIVTASS